MTGALAGIVGFDALSLTGEELELTDAERAAGMSCADKLEWIAAEASNEGTILTLSMHIPNLARAAKRPQEDGGYDFSGYSPDDLSGHVLHRAVPGGDLHPVYTAYLDIVADFLLRMQRRGSSMRILRRSGSCSTQSTDIRTTRIINFFASIAVRTPIRRT